MFISLSFSPWASYGPKEREINMSACVWPVSAADGTRPIPMLVIDAWVWPASHTPSALVVFGILKKFRYQSYTNAATSVITLSPEFVCCVVCWNKSLCSLRFLCSFLLAGLIFVASHPHRGCDPQFPPAYFSNEKQKQTANACRGTMNSRRVFAT